MVLRNPEIIVPCKCWRQYCQVWLNTRNSRFQWPMGMFLFTPSNHETVDWTQKEFWGTQEQTTATRTKTNFQEPAASTSYNRFIPCLFILHATNTMAPIYGGIEDKKRGISYQVYYVYSLQKHCSKNLFHRMSKDAEVFGSSMDFGLWKE